MSTQGSDVQSPWPASRKVLAQDYHGYERFATFLRFRTLGYIDKEELNIKIEMCGFFGVKPLFIMRYAPKSYIKLIFDSGGFALLFETQIYELSQIELVKKVKETAGLPVVSTKSIPDGIIDRFEKWHKTKIKM